MADTPDWQDELDERELILSSRLSSGHNAKSPQRLLARALLESVVGMEGIAKLHESPRFCAVIKVPAADWAAPMLAFLKPWGWGFAHSRVLPLRGSQLHEDMTSQQTMATLSSGGRVLGISHDPARLLPASMRSCADMVVELPPPNGRVLAAVIKAMTGKVPRNLPDDMPIPLGFDEICSCLRPKESATRCVERLKRAITGGGRVDPLTKDVPHVRDLHGYGEAQTWALNLAEDLEAWRRGEIEFDQVDANVVLASEPGLGKTTFARSLARSLGLPLIATSVAQWFSNSPGFLDSVIKQIDQLFEQAKAEAPAVVFFDELDAVPNRATISSRGADWWLPVITHLLTKLDGAVSDTTDRLIIVGATNHPQKLDAALVRPGRLNRIIQIAPPDAQAMAGILRQHLGDDLAGDDLTHVAQIAAGNSGAAVVQWVKAARRTARSQKRPMVLSDLIAVVAPEDGRSPEDLYVTAVHEAAHAVAAQALGVGTVCSISLIPRGDSLGRTAIRLKNALGSRKDVETLVMQTLAGRAAEEALLGEPGIGSGGQANSDLAVATRYIGTLYVSEGFGDTLIYRGDSMEVLSVLAVQPEIAAVVEAQLQILYRKTLELVRECEVRIRAVADDLLRTRYVSGDRFYQLVAGADAGNATTTGSAQND